MTQKNRRYIFEENGENAYLYLAGEPKKVAKTVAIDLPLDTVSDVEVNLDFDERNKLIGIEFMRNS
ncbi:hypothetical protein GCM10007853_03950 [Algimonas ampicilliniresistens]|uniref:DUF2283 domain-containing protein n=1 Tax=Algimonas ampicilliniresistens TaxID=1298735 RepID=A0ABQ5V7G5_9PROT|nr:DUF2283 domain-containing protein [Algimonas ampicilliniresistens]GLQ22521.1 hypothetical protein GCM10007853_03950 [Algimonas ampicilliniresistens]